jgi:hypothetical protein
MNFDEESAGFTGRLKRLRTKEREMTLRENSVMETSQSSSVSESSSRTELDKKDGAIDNLKGLLEQSYVSRAISASKIDALKQRVKSLEEILEAAPKKRFGIF